MSKASSRKKNATSKTYKADKHSKRSGLKPGDAQAHPLSFSMPEVYQQQLDAGNLTKGQRTLLRFKIGVALSLETMPYQVMRVADIADAADLSYGLFYHYYKDKESATIDVLAEFLSHLETLYQNIHTIDDDYESIYQPNLFYLDVNRRNPGIIRACLTVSEEVETFRTTWVELIDRWHRRMGQSFRRHHKEPDLLLPDEELVAYGVGGLIDQFCRQIFAQQNPFLSRLIVDTHHLAETVSILWYRAIYGRSPSQEQVLRCRSLRSTDSE